MGKGTLYPPRFIFFDVLGHDVIQCSGWREWSKSPQRYAAHGQGRKIPGAVAGRVVCNLWIRPEIFLQYLDDYYRFIWIFWKYFGGLGGACGKLLSASLTELPNQG